ncbi:Circumsporozoite protein [Merluccius polli]|uniref:Circumsporozoite protein n=1 Tax=Merluccius polli TaxID=89951 RepID=A0AA47N998_MERPO|nr:Circumsporozoite protein [Merluccius polli]
MARNRRLALALALTDDEENHVPACLWVHDITRGRQQQGADQNVVQELRFDDARFAAYCDWSAVKKTPDAGAFFLKRERIQKKRFQNLRITFLKIQSLTVTLKKMMRLSISQFQNEDEPQDQAVSSQPQDQADQAVSSQPQDEAVSSQPQDQAVSSQPQDEAVSSQPQDQAVSSQPQDEAVSSQPQDEAVSSQPQDQAVSSQPQDQAVSSQPQDQAVSSQRQDQAFSSQPQDQNKTVSMEQVRKYGCQKILKLNGLLTQEKSHPARLPM